MMTARAEYRLSLRADNATYAAGRGGARSATAFRRGVAPKSKSHFELRGERSMGGDRRGPGGPRSTRPMSSASSANGKPCSATSRVWIPAELDFASVPGSPHEMVERLDASRPETLDQASRIPGVTPAALSALYVAASSPRAA